MSRPFPTIVRASFIDFGSKRARVVPVCQQENAKSACHPALSGSCFQELLTNGKAVPVALERASQIALIPLHVADVVVADGEITLPPRHCRGLALRASHECQGCPGNS